MSVAANRARRRKTSSVLCSPGALFVVACEPRARYFWSQRIAALSKPAKCQHDEDLVLLA